MEKIGAEADMEWFTSEAPSNIALIKYMGKIKAASDSNLKNIPTNASLSWTLDHLKTRVRVGFETNSGACVIWRPLSSKGFHAPVLSKKGEARFLAHAERCLEKFGLAVPTGRVLIVESGNGFPSDCGLASSASSFAALTLAVAQLAGQDVTSEAGRKRLADLSREGSGSSCRSFFSPWCAWLPSGVEPLEGFPSAKNLRHLALIVDESKKAVSSSEAHLRVTSSLLFRGRTERAEQRLSELSLNLRKSTDSATAWNLAVEIVGAESWDMHALFETSQPAFGYFTEGSMRVLNAVREVSLELSSRYGVDVYRRPMMTMDAGPNVHILLWNDSSTEETIAKLKQAWGPSMKVIDSNGS